MKFKNQIKLDQLIRWFGTPQSLLMHSIFFTLMFLLPFFGIDKNFSLLLFTTIVSLEAIYLNIFIQMGVNRHADEQRETKLVLSNVQETIEDVQETVEDVQETVEDVQETIDEENEEEMKNQVEISFSNDDADIAYIKLNGKLVDDVHFYHLFNKMKEDENLLNIDINGKTFTRQEIFDIAKKLNY